MLCTLRKAVAEVRVEVSEKHSERINETRRVLKSK